MGIRFQLASHPVDAELQGELTILDPVGSRYYGLEEVGALVWEALRQPRTLDELLAVVMAEYEVDEATLRADLTGFLAELEDRSLVERCP